MFQRAASIFLLFSLFLTACRAQVPPNGSPVPPPTNSQPTDTRAALTQTPQITDTPTATPRPVEPTPTPGIGAPAAPNSVTPTLSPTAVETQAPTATQLPQTPAAATEQAPTESSDETAAPADACLEKAAFYGDVSIPDDTFFRQGEAFTKTWRFRNEGTCTWNPDYKVVFKSGEIMDAPLSNPFPGSVPPGEQVEISIDMRAPTRGGPFQSIWEFENPVGVRFGTGSAASDPFWVKIDVRFLDQNDQPQPDPGIQAPASTPAGCGAQQDTGVEAQVFELINQARSANGLGQLTLNTALSAAALVHSTDMACNNFVAHSGSDGSNWADRISAQGYHYSTYPLENIYVGDPQFGGDAQGAVTWWMNSQVHRDNILNSTVTEAGIGYVFDSNSEYGGYYTMDFASP